MLHAYVQRFDVTRNLKKFYKILGTKQALCIRGKSKAQVERASYICSFSKGRSFVSEGVTRELKIVRDYSFVIAKVEFRRSF